MLLDEFPQCLESLHVCETEIHILFFEKAFDVAEHPLLGESMEKGYLMVIMEHDNSISKVGLGAGIKAFLLIDGDQFFKTK